MAIRFNSPPGWPTPPTGWSPPPDWSPDPSWPPLPTGWRLWVLEGSVVDADTVGLRFSARPSTKAAKWSEEYSLEAIAS